MDDDRDDLAARVAVCSWSLRPADPLDLVAKLSRTGCSRVQLALDPLRENRRWQAAGSTLTEAGVEIVSGMFAAVGEDYDTLDSIRRTGGVVPDATWPANLANFEGVLAVAAELGLGLVTFHAGFLPADPRSADFGKLLDRLHRFADLGSAAGIELGLETGQEDADTLLEFLGRLDRPEVGVNFDPANMILYDKGDPVESLRRLAGVVKQCHIKDAKRTRRPGQWGEEVLVGSGEVRWGELFAALDELGYHGDLVIEREAGDRREEDVRTARDLVREQLRGLGGGGHP